MVERCVLGDGIEVGVKVLNICQHVPFDPQFHKHKLGDVGGVGLVLGEA